MDALNGKKKKNITISKLRKTVCSCEVKYVQFEIKGAKTRKITAMVL